MLLHPGSCHRSAGFSLIEILVAIVVLSFGLLGMVGLQAAALQANRDARLQSTAGTLARELAEMMRGNQDVAATAAASANPYLGEFTSSPLALGSPEYCLSAGTACATGSETSDADKKAMRQKIARAEMTEWLARVDAELPGARVSVCLDSAPYDSAGLPQWTCTAPATTSNAIAVVKIGWTRASTNRSATGAAALDTATRPGIVFPVTPGTVL
ncbi:type IV pilus modification protein PilV [Xylophilus sp.]|uniref:type IV pilus modification protein PilV n=1 Tax=Xylophilus sp. TaxID=2653893 RepID=UPI0013B6DB08|nr:type IV pilus modification protein PilV [Xylophilus sp.]KAF1046663.1 MAG: hypothetical protein GAK38_02399 [Xylophilus sp.]